MTRDIRDRLGHFIGVDRARDLFADLESRGVGRGAITGQARAGMQDELQEFMDRLRVRRIALNMDQIEEHGPPPNPAKMSDARAGGYVERYGRESWELDALPPDVLGDLIRSEVDSELDRHLFAAARKQERAERGRIWKLARSWRAT